MGGFYHFSSSSYTKQVDQNRNIIVRNTPITYRGTSIIVVRHEVLQRFQGYMANKKKLAQAQTVAQAFQQAGLAQWWKTPSQRFGQAWNGEVEEGTDFSIGLKTPIGSITTGKVIYVGGGGYNDPSLGTIVQVQQADGSIVHYQHLSSSNLKVGQQVGIASVIGLSGGIAGRFSSGPHIEVRFASKYAPNSGVWSQHWIDSYPIIQQMTQASPTGQGVGGGPSAGNSIGGSTGSTLGASFSFPTISLSPTDDVTQVLWTIDELMQLIPPWNVPPSPVTVSVVGVNITGFNDPISWFEGFLFNVGADMIALILRGILLIWGLFLGYKVLSNFIDVGAIAANTARAGTSIARLGAMVA